MNLASFAGVRRSVRGKLMRVVLITTVITLFVAGAFMLSADINRYKQYWIADLGTEASILAVSLAPAVAFDDHDAALRDLRAITVRPRVMVAAVYSANGSLYASFVRTPGQSLPAHAPAPGLVTAGERVEYAYSIERNGEQLGTIYLRARYDTLGSIEDYLAIFVLVTLVSMVVAFLLSRRLQQGILQPLDAMAVIANAIVTRRDYSLRAKKTSEDEIGVVVDAFNNMLDEVNARADALERSNRALSEEVEVRTTTQAALSLANTRLESTMAAAEIGSWFWDLKKNEFSADRNLFALYDVNEDKELATSPDWHHRHIHPEDLPLVRQSEQNALTSGVFASTEFRVILKDGSMKWMARRGKVQLDERGKAIFISGLVIDITAQKEAEKALRASEKLYRAIGESINYGVWVCDRAGRNIYASESLLRLVGLTQAQWSELGWSSRLHPDDSAQALRAWENVVNSGGGWYQELRMRGADGRYHWILSQGVPIRGEDATISGWAGINLDIGRLKLTEEALREADRRKDEFLATLAHELRNPLAPIRHAARILESKAMDEAQQTWARGVISRQVRRMALLLDDLLDISRITQGRLELKIETVSVESIVDAATEIARPLIEAKRQHLEIELPAAPVLLNVDALRISQSLANLVTNSAKYTDAQGRIIVRARLVDEEMVFSVADNGIGFVPDTAPKLFEMFSQASSAVARSEGGLGIGLALVKGLVELHAGTVAAHSPGIGQGSEFSIHLPRAAVSSVAPQASAQRPPVRQVDAITRRLVIADDNRDAADSLALLLEMLGYQVTVAYTGSEALQIIAAAAPPVAILDIGMPDMTGYEVATRIRAEAWGRNICLIAMTGWGQEDDKARASAAGFDHHLTKPVDPDDVERLLQAVFTAQAERPAAAP